MKLFLQLPLFVSAAVSDDTALEMFHVVEHSSSSFKTQLVNINCIRDFFKQPEIREADFHRVFHMYEHIMSQVINFNETLTSLQCN